MTQLEKRLRTAFRAKATEVPASPPATEADPQPARDPALGDGEDGGEGRRSARRRWLIPAGAFVAVLAVTAGALAVAGLLPGQGAQPAAQIQVNVPPYYVALMASKGIPGGGLYPGTAAVATVRATSSGAVLAKVRAPRPYAFAAITAATDDRSFVLLAVGPVTKAAKFPGMLAGRNYAERFYFLRIHPTARSAQVQLTPLDEEDIGDGSVVEAMALSPDGQSLAVIMSDPDRTIGTVTPAQLTIFNLADGAQRTWTREVCAYGKCAPGPIGAEGPILIEPSALQLSWTSDGRSLLFVTGPASAQVRLLHVDAPGSNLTADSSVLPVTTAVRNWVDAVITPNGKSVFVDYTSGAGAYGQTLLRFSARTGRTTVVNHILMSVGGHETLYGPDLLAWTNDSGSKIIVVGAQPGTPANHPKYPFELEHYPTAGIYAGGRYTPIPWPHGIFDAAW
jgi:hypothetical protein